MCYNFTQRDIWEAVGISKNKSTYAVCALIGVGFLMKGSTYITWWLYKLPQVFGNTAVDLLSEGAGYAFQALGILLFSLLMKRNSRSAHSKITFA